MSTGRHKPRNDRLCAAPYAERLQALPSDRATVRAQADAAISKLLATYARVLPKAHLTAASVRQLLEHKDNKVIAAAKELCCSQRAESLFDPGAPRMAFP